MELLQIFSIYSINSLYGFRDAVTIKNIDDEVIDKLEKFIKDDIINILTNIEAAAEDGFKFDKTMFFGNLHAKNPDSFNIVLGERYQLKEVATFTKSIFDSFGSSYYADKRKSKLVKYLNIIDCGNLGKFFSSDCSKTKVMKHETTKMQSSLHEQVIDILKRSKIGESLLSELPIDAIIIEENDGVLRGKVPCILCKTDPNKKMTEFTYNAKIEGTKTYWISSYYLKHLRGVHDLKIPRKQTKYSKNSDTQRKIPKIDQNDESIDMNLSSAKEEIEIVDNIGEQPADDKSGQKKSNDEQYIEESQIEITDQFYVDCDKNIGCIQNQILNQISEHSISMMQTSKINNDAGRPMEFVCCGEHLFCKIAKVKRDGNCLFGAIAHQLYKFNLDSEEHTIMTNQLREEAISFISTNISLFRSELENRVYDKDGKNKDFSMDDEIHKFIASLFNNGVWGGAESLKAIHLFHKCNILVISELGGFYFANPFNQSFKSILTIAFRVKGQNYRTKKNVSNIDRDHYDSVIDIEPNDIFSIAEALSETVKRIHNNKSLKNDTIISIDDDDD